MIAVYSGFTRQGQQTVTHGTVMWQWSINHDLGQSCGSGLSTMTWDSHVAVVYQPWPGAVMWQWSINHDLGQSCGSGLSQMTVDDIIDVKHVHFNSSHWLTCLDADMSQDTQPRTLQTGLSFMPLLGWPRHCTCMALAEQSTWQLTNVAMDVDHTWWAWAGQEVIRLKWWNYYVDMIPDVDRGSLFHVL